MNLTTKKSSQAKSGAKSAMDLFAQAQKKMKKSNEIALEAKAENEAKIKAMIAENEEMDDLVKVNTIFSDNIDKLLTKPIAVNAEAEKEKSVS